MREIPSDPQVREIWKSFPMRIPGFVTSGCCRAQAILVQSMEGGYVTRNCSACGAKVSMLSSAEVQRLDLWVACSQCRGRIEKARLAHSNYGFQCVSC
jgi:DNA-directed RNA polymerase subunit RPC12/RpoP